MTAETQVVKEVAEVSKIETDEKGGLDVSYTQDLIKPNGINHVGDNAVSDPDSRDDTGDNSYVFVSGADVGAGDNSTGQVITVNDSKVSPESVTPQNHVGSGQTKISNGDVPHYSLPESNGIVTTNADPVDNVDSLISCEGDVVQVAMASSEEQNGGIEGIANAEPKQVKDHVELESSVTSAEIEESQAEITGSVEQINDNIAQNGNTKIEQLEVSPPSTESKISELVVSEANSVSEGSDEKNNLLPDADAHYENKETKEANLQTSDEISQSQDPHVLVSDINVESGSTKELKMVSPEINQTGGVKEEDMDSNFDSSQNLSEGCDSKHELSDVKLESRGDLEIVSPDMRDSGDDNQGIDEVQECRNVDLRMDVDLGDGRGLKVPSLDVEEAGEEIKKTEVKSLVTCHELEEAQQSAIIESANTHSEEQKDITLSNEFEGLESQNVFSPVPAYQPAEVDVEDGDSEETNSLSSSEKLRENPKSEDVISEASLDQSGNIDVRLTDESIEGHSSENVATEAPEPVLEEAEESEKNENTAQIPLSVSLEFASSHPDNGEEKHIPKENAVSHLNGDGIHMSDAGLYPNTQSNSEAKTSVNETDAPLEAKNEVGSLSDGNKDDLDVSHISDCAQQTDAPTSSSGGDENSVEVNGASLIDSGLALADSRNPENEITGRPVESDECCASDSRDVTTSHHDLDVSYISDCAQQSYAPISCNGGDENSGKVSGSSLSDHGLALADSMNPENEITSRPVESDECFTSVSRDPTAHHEIKPHSSTPSDAKCIEDIVPCPVDNAKVESIESDAVASNVSVDGHSVSSYPVTDNGFGAEPSLENIDEEKVHTEGKDVHFKTKDISGIDEFPGSPSVSADADKDSQAEHSCTEKSHITEVAAPIATADAMAGQAEVMTRPFNFLIKVPRFDDEKLRERIRHAQLKVEEKTQNRDAFRLEIQKKKANLYAYGIEFESAIVEERDARRLVKKKRIEIDDLQTLINRVKNAISVEDIDARILNMEHMIQHETMPLKEEKQFIREIKQMKQLREQLSSNIGNENEVQQALEQKDNIEDRLKVLKKELEGCKKSVLKAEAVATTARKKYDDENKKLKELLFQFKAADDIRQAAYAELLSLRKELFEKNKQFRMYKDDTVAATDLAVNRDREALNRLCLNQVETVMELWNKNDEFRKDYVRCNLRSTVRRLGTLDGRSLGPDEDPPVVPSYADERVDRLKFNPPKASTVLQNMVAEQKTEVSPVESVVADKPKIKMAESLKETVKAREPAKPTLANGLPSSSAKSTINDNREEEPSQSKQELELARKAEELRKEEEAAKLKELRRVEEIAKAKEALERKKRIAEKAQMRAELRAQKEAEQKEKEREKRLRKKERKKGDADAHEGNNNAENAQSSGSSIETVKEPEIKEIPPTVTKRPQKPSQFVKQSKSKAIPPPLRNRSRRKMQQWMWVIFTSIAVIALFLLGNIGVFSNLRQRKAGF